LLCPINEHRAGGRGRLKESPLEILKNDPLSHLKFVRKIFWETFKKKIRKKCKIGKKQDF